MTARHVVKDRDPNEILFLRRPEVPLEFLDGIPPSLPPGQHLERDFLLPIDDVILSGPSDDLAALRLIGTPKQVEPMYFFDIEESANLPDEGQAVLVVGTLRTLVRLARLGDQRHVVSLFIEGARIQRLENPPHDFEPNRHFAMLRVATKEADPPVDPRGLSGAGVWVTPRAGDDTIWDSSQLRLVGVQTGWYEARNVLKATRIERLVELMKTAR